MRGNHVRVITFCALLSVLVPGCQAHRSSGGITGARSTDGSGGPSAPMEPTAPVAPSRTADRNDPLRPRVRMETSLGGFVVELNGEKAPATALNFLQLVYEGHYDGTIVHRVLAGSMVQGGGYTPDLEPRPLERAPQFTDDWRSDLANTQRSIGLIRALGSPTGGAEFYINLADNVRLDEAKRKGLYSVFGRVVEGWDVVERIGRVEVGPHEKYAAGQSAVVPTTPIFVESAKVIGAFNPVPLQQAMYAERMTQEQQAEQQIEAFAAETGKVVVRTESGLWYVDVIEGKGMAPTLTDTVEMNYQGKLVDGTVVETTFTDEPTTRQPGKLIKGLQEALTTMKEGGRRVVVVPPEMAFGPNGIPGHIPPDAYMFFEIELLAIR